MGPREDARSLVIDAFPGHDAVIDRALRDHPSFRELCEDYRRCASAFARWRRVGGDASTARRREYEQLLAELADELQFWIETLEEGAGRRDGVDPR